MENQNQTVPVPEKPKLKSKSNPWMTVSWALGLVLVVAACAAGFYYLQQQGNVEFNNPSSRISTTTSQPESLPLSAALISPKEDNEIKNWKSFVADNYSFKLPQSFASAPEKDSLDFAISEIAAKNYENCYGTLSGSAIESCFFDNIILDQVSANIYSKPEWEKHTNDVSMTNAKLYVDSSGRTWLYNLDMPESWNLDATRVNGDKIYTFSLQITTINFEKYSGIPSTIGDSSNPKFDAAIDKFVQNILDTVQIQGDVMPVGSGKGWRTYQNSQLGFSFNYPAEWGNSFERIDDAATVGQGDSGKIFSLWFQNSGNSLTGKSADFTAGRDAFPTDFSGNAKKPAGVSSLINTGTPGCTYTGAFTSPITSYIYFNLPGKEISGVTLQLPIVSASDLSQIDKKYNNNPIDCSDPTNAKANLANSQVDTKSKAIQAWIDDTLNVDAESTYDKLIFQAVSNSAKAF